MVPRYSRVSDLKSRLKRVRLPFVFPVSGSAPRGKRARCSLTRPSMPTVRLEVNSSLG